MSKYCMVQRIHVEVAVICVVVGAAVGKDTVRCVISVSIMVKGTDSGSGEVGHASMTATWSTVTPAVPVRVVKKMLVTIVG